MPTQPPSTASVVIERTFAAAVVLAWAVAGHLYFGFSAALGIVLLLLVPLAFIWFPELLSREAGKACPRLLQPDITVHPAILRVLGWTVITAIPAVFAVFYAQGIREWQSL